MPAEPRSLAERLRWLRKQRGLTQVELSLAMGCEQAVISSWEVGRTRPTAVSLGALAKHFQVSITALDTGNGFREEAEKYEALRTGEGAAAAENLALQVSLPPNAAGKLMFVDTLKGNQEGADLGEVMAQLLRALKKGRKAWIVVD